jgi:hypothetical protein
MSLLYYQSGTNEMKGRFQTLPLQRGSKSMTTVVTRAGQISLLRIAMPIPPAMRVNTLKSYEALGQLGWVMPNQDSPNYHREYQVGAGRYGMAADAAKGWFTAYKA